MPKLPGKGRGVSPKVTEAAAGNITDLLKGTAKGVATGAFNGTGTKGKPPKDIFFGPRARCSAPTSPARSGSSGVLAGCGEFADRAIASQTCRDRRLTVP